MTNDKQAEVWRAEFECEAKKLYPFNSLNRLPDNSAYIDPLIFHLEKGFLMAKRSMKPIELPKKCESLVFQSTFNADDVELAITAAGYSYRVKEWAH